MRAKVTGHNQLSFPEELAWALQGREFFEVSEEFGKLVLTPVAVSELDKVRMELANRGITQQDIDDAVKWARGK